MEKIVALVKGLIQPKEKEGNHLESHAQINALFSVFTEEVRKIWTAIKGFEELVKNADGNVNNVMKKMESAQKGINEVIKITENNMIKYVNEKTKTEHFLVRYEGMISTDREIMYELEPIQPKFGGAYRMEVIGIRISHTNENVDLVQLPGIQIHEGDFKPSIFMRAKAGKAIYEYDFDVLVTKL